MQRPNGTAYFRCSARLFIDREVGVLLPKLGPNFCSSFATGAPLSEQNTENTTFWSGSKIHGTNLFFF
jgi:hypothetical protein